MVQRPSGREDHFDLLPFIAILMCVLGTELLVTVSMATLSLGAGGKEGWVPAKDDTAATKTAVLIEWDGQAVVVHRGRARQTVAVTFVSGQAPSELTTLIDELEARKATHYALFAVRPTGFENYERLAAQFRRRDIGTGFEPIEQGKTVQLMSEGDRR